MTIHENTPLIEPNDPYSQPNFKLAGFTLWVLGYQFPEIDEFWDGNWLNVRIRVQAPGAIVEAEGPFVHASEFASFAEQLEAMDKILLGEANLNCMEPNLGMKVICSPLGHVEVSIFITHEHLSQTHKFTFCVDQTFLRPAITDAKLTMSRFPIRGKARV